MFAAEDVCVAVGDDTGDRNTNTRFRPRPMRGLKARREMLDGRSRAVEVHWTVY
jgi:hypothetical protein